MHVMIDEPDEDHDRAVASHILAVHQLKPAALSARYSMAQMQRYIKYVRAIKPQLSEAVSRPPAARRSLRCSHSKHAVHWRRPLLHRNHRPESL
jgi:hypothetical protein